MAVELDYSDDDDEDDGDVGEGEAGAAAAAAADAAAAAAAAGSGDAPLQDDKIGVAVDDDDDDEGDEDGDEGGSEGGSEGGNEGGGEAGAAGAPGAAAQDQEGDDAAATAAAPPPPALGPSFAGQYQVEFTKMPLGLHLYMAMSTDNPPVLTSAVQLPVTGQEAQASGVRPGDLLVSVAGEPVNTLNRHQLLALLMRPAKAIALDRRTSRVRYLTKRFGSHAPYWQFV
eukprot:g6381.t1